MDSLNLVCIVIVRERDREIERVKEMISCICVLLVCPEI